MSEQETTTRGDWNKARSLPLVTQISYAMSVAGQAEEDHLFMADLESNGLSPEPYTFSMQVTPGTYNAIQAGLMLVGIFSEDLGDAADKALTELYASHDRLEEGLSDEDRQALRDAVSAMFERDELSMMFGAPVESITDSDLGDEA